MKKSATHAKPRSMEVRRTLAMESLEQELGTAMTAFLLRSLRTGTSRAELAREFGVHPSTVSNWARKMGYGQRDVVSAGWRSGLIVQARYAR